MKSAGAEMSRLILRSLSLVGTLFGAVVALLITFIGNWLYNTDLFTGTSAWNFGLFWRGWIVSPSYQFCGLCGWNWGNYDKLSPTQLTIVATMNTLFLVTMGWLLGCVIDFVANKYKNSKTA
jgi:hypothetical protein